VIRINIAAVGKLKENYWVEAFAEYEKRLSRFCSFSVCEIPEAAGSIEVQKAAEGKEILKKIKGAAILLDIGGEPLSSEGFAQLIDQSAARGNSEFTFIIGGSHGVSDEVKNAASKRISFGNITYPHRLIRIILAEQIYRAFAIINNTGYHK